MPDPKPPIQPTPFVEASPTSPQEYDGVFHHEGRFPIDSILHKGSGYHSYMLRIDRESPNSMSGTYMDLVRKYQETLPQPKSDFFSTGLNRDQTARVIAAQEFILNQNGGAPTRTSIQTNSDLYADPLELSLSTFISKGKGALTCVESSVLTQQLLTPVEDVSYVSGVADLNGDGQGEAHSFNIIQVADTQQFAGAILDIANPVYTVGEDGTTNVNLYCAPLTQQQLGDFKDGKPVALTYRGVQRTYSYGMVLYGKEKRAW